MPRFKLVLMRPTTEYAEVELVAESADAAEQIAPTHSNLRWEGDEDVPTADEVTVLSCDEIPE